MRLLHLSDLHFGYDADKTQMEKRENCLNDAKNFLKEHSEKLPFDYLVISGDIAWRAAMHDYDLAEKYIEELLDVLKIPKQKTILCPGNHDIQRDVAESLSVPTNYEQATKLYSLEKMNMLSQAFENYSGFCARIGIAQPQIREYVDCKYLVGVVQCEDVDFVVMNSAWAAIDAEHLDMWIGNNFIESIRAANLVNTDGTKLVISVVHHPKDNLSEHEKRSYGNNVNTYKRICEMSDLILYGHTHNVQASKGSLLEGGYEIGIGSTYAGNTYTNNFCIYEIPDKNSLHITPVSFMNAEWKAGDCEKYKLREDHIIAESHEEESFDESEDELDVYKQLISLGFSIEKCKKEDFDQAGTILWPVVPRKYVTHIHLAQIELMSVMSTLFGWEIHVLLSNCGSKVEKLKKEELLSFQKKIIEIIKRRGGNYEGCSLLNNFFEPSNDLAKNVLDEFISISSEVKKSQLESLKNKKYDKEVQEKNNSLPVLDYILPILQMSTICCLSKKILEAKKGLGKVLVLAGKDELEQWRHVCREFGNQQGLGVILIPNLRNDEKTDTWQQGIKKYLSAEELHEDITKGNFGHWSYTLFIKLQEISKEKAISQYPLTKDIYEKWSKNPFISQEEVDYKKLADEVWKTLCLAT